MDVSRVLRRYAERAADDHARDIDSRRVRQRTEVHLKPWTRPQAVVGDEVMTRLRKTLDAWGPCGYARSSAQERLHSLFMAATARKIYGSDFHAHAGRLKLENGWDEIKLHAVTRAGT
jgi:hypothetical protein